LIWAPLVCCKGIRGGPLIRATHIFHYRLSHGVFAGGSPFSRGDPFMWARFPKNLGLLRCYDFVSGLSFLLLALQGPGHFTFLTSLSFLSSPFSFLERADESDFNRLWIWHSFESTAPVFFR